MDEAGLQRLLADAQRRDPAALRELVESFSPRVYGLLYRMTGSHDAAEDLLQTVFLRVVRMLPGYEHNGLFTAWLFRIAANLVRDRARSHNRRLRVFEAELSAEHASAERISASSEPNPAEQFEQRESEQRLQSALGDLAELDREIVLLRHFSDLSFREIADMLQMPLGTVLSRAHRALAKLRASLDDNDPPANRIGLSGPAPQRRERA